MNKKKKKTNFQFAQYFDILFMLIKVVPFGAKGYRGEILLLLFFILKITITIKSAREREKKLKLI